jgi:hypothetical protein
MIDFLLGTKNINILLHVSSLHQDWQSMLELKNRVNCNLVKEGSVPKWPKGDMPTIVFFKDYSIMSIYSLMKNDNQEQICIIFTNQILTSIFRSLNIFFKC